MRLAVYSSLAAAALSGFLVWGFQGARMDARVAELQLEIAEQATTQERQYREADRRTYETSKAIYDQYAKALNDAIARNTALEASATRAAAVTRGLRKALDTANARLAEATESAAREYAATVGELFGHCSARYTELARKADGHASDAAACRAAWPVIQGENNGKTESHD